MIVKITATYTDGDKVLHVGPRWVITEYSRTRKGDRKRAVTHAMKAARKRWKNADRWSAEIVEPHTDLDWQFTKFLQEYDMGVQDHEPI